ncbi:MAG: hypothetical protein JSS72_13715 [Armatimonadetes bacterium]|nr:hypothetical protein [Armatimonadota bacterium]
MRIKSTKEWLISQIVDRKQPKEARKRHKAGKLTQAQLLRSRWQTRQEMFDGWNDVVDATPVT